MSLGAVEEPMHLSHWLLIVNIISAQIEASISVVMQVCPPKTCKHLKHQICHNVILDIISQASPTCAEGDGSYARMGIWNRSSQSIMLIFVGPCLKQRCMKNPSSQAQPHTRQGFEPRIQNKYENHFKYVLI